MYWKPVFYVPRRDRHVPAGQRRPHQAGPRAEDGRAGLHWIAQLLEHGLLRGSFVPPAADRELRDLTRLPEGVDPGAAARGQPPAQAVARTPASSWPRSPPTSSGSRAAPCWRRWCRARPIPRCWPTWRGAGCARSWPALRQALAGRFRPHHAFLVESAAGPPGLPGRSDRHGQRGGRRAPRPFREPADPPGHGPRDRPPHGRGPPRGDRRGHEPLPERPASRQLGRRCARATTRAPANTSPARPGRATAGCGWPSSKRRLAPSAPRTAPWRPGIAASCAIAATRKRSWRSPMRCSERSITSSPSGTPYRDPGPDYYDRRHAHRVTRRAVELLQRQGYRVVLEPAA